MQTCSPSSALLPERGAAPNRAKHRKPNGEERSLLVRVSEIDGWKLGAVQTPLTEVRSLIRPQDPTSPLGFSPGSQPGTSLHASRAVKVLEEAQSKQREQQLLSTAYLARALPPPKQAVPHSCGWRSNFPTSAHFYGSDHLINPPQPAPQSSSLCGEHHRGQEKPAASSLLGQPWQQRGRAEEPYLLPRRCGGMLVLQSHRARSISSHLLCRAAKAASDKSSIWKGKGRGWVRALVY